MCLDCFYWYMYKYILNNLYNVLAISDTPPHMSSQVDINNLLANLLKSGIIGESTKPDSPQTVQGEDDKGGPSIQQQRQPPNLDNLKITMEPCTPEEMFIPVITLKSHELKK